MKTDSSILPFKKLTPIEVLLIVLFLIAPCVYFPNIGGTGLRIPNNITVWFVANIIIWYSVYYLVKKRVIVKPKYFIFIAAFPILATVSGFISDVINPIEWFFRLLYIWLGLLFFLGLFQFKLSRGRIDRILFFIVISALVQSIIGVIQVSLAQDSMPLGFPSIINQTLVPYGFFRQNNNQATFQVTALVIAAYLISRPYITSANLWKKLVVLIFISFSSYVVVSSGSRIGFLSLAIALPLIIVGCFTALKKQRSLSLLAFVCLLIGMSLGSSGFGRVIDKTEQLSKGYSVSHRIGIYAVSLDLIEEKPFFGHGLGSFKKVWQYEKADFYEKHPEAMLIDGYVTHPHNEFLFWAVEGGIVSLFGLLLVAAGIVLSLRSVDKRRRLIFLSLLLPVSLHTQVELPFYSSCFHWFLALFLLFIMMREQAYTRKLELSSAALTTSKGFALSMQLLGSLFLIHSLVANYEMGGKKNNLWNLNYAESNPYFNTLLESAQMKSVFLMSYRAGEIDGMKAYTEWAENYLSIEPSDTMFVFLALAYQSLDEKPEMCRVLQLGSSIYPSNKELESGKMFCAR